MKYCVGLCFRHLDLPHEKGFFYFSLSSDSELTKRSAFFELNRNRLNKRSLEKLLAVNWHLLFCFLFVLHYYSFFSYFVIFKTSVNSKLCKVFAIHIFVKTFQRDIYEGIFLKGLYLRRFLSLFMSLFLTASYGSHERTEKSYIA